MLPEVTRPPAAHFLSPHFTVSRRIVGACIRTLRPKKPVSQAARLKPKGTAMATFLATFRVSNETSALGSYYERYSSIVEEINKLSSEPNTWDETTSVIVLRCALSPEEFVRLVYLRSRLDKGIDILSVFELEPTKYATVGPLKYPLRLDSLLSRADQLVELLNVLAAKMTASR